MTYDVSPTPKQRKAAEALIANGGNVSKAMKDAGYTEATSKNPKNLTNSKGFQELCEQLGLTDQLLLEALVYDIANKKKNRKAELELGFKVKGRLTEKHEVTVNTVEKILEGYGITEGSNDRQDDATLPSASEGQTQD